MDYAIVSDGLVTNIISLNDANAHEFPGAVALGGRPVGIGDEYADGVFTRGGIPILTPLEAAQQLIAQLDAAIVDLEYRAVLRDLGLEPA